MKGRILFPTVGGEDGGDGGASLRLSRQMSGSFTSVSSTATEPVSPRTVPLSAARRESQGLSRLSMSQELPHAADSSHDCPNSVLLDHRNMRPTWPFEGTRSTGFRMLWLDAETTLGCGRQQPMGDGDVAPCRLLWKVANALQKMASSAQQQHIAAMLRTTKATISRPTNMTELTGSKGGCFRRTPSI